MKACRDPFKLHLPTVKKLHDTHHVVCERCGLALDFRPLEDQGFNVSDWDAPIYEAPDVNALWDARRESYLARLVVEAAEKEKREKESKPYIALREFKELDAAVAAYRAEFSS